MDFEIWLIIAFTVYTVVYICHCLEPCWKFYRSFQLFFLHGLPFLFTFGRVIVQYHQGIISPPNQSCELFVKFWLFLILQSFSFHQVGLQAVELCHYFSVMLNLLMFRRQSPLFKASVRIWHPKGNASEGKKRSLRVTATEHHSKDSSFKVLTCELWILSRRPVSNIFFLITKIEAKRVKLMMDSPILKRVPCLLRVWVLSTLVLVICFQVQLYR